MLQAEGTERTGPVQGRLYRSLKLWTFYCDLEESLGTLESTKAVYDSIMDLKLATPQIVLNYAAFLQVKVKRWPSDMSGKLQHCMWLGHLLGAPHPGKLLLSSRLQRRGCSCPETASSVYPARSSWLHLFHHNHLSLAAGAEGQRGIQMLHWPAVVLLSCRTTADCHRCRSTSGGRSRSRCMSVRSAAPCSAGPMWAPSGRPTCPSLWSGTREPSWSGRETSTSRPSRRWVSGVWISRLSGLLSSGALPAVHRPGNVTGRPSKRGLGWPDLPGKA